MLSPLLSLTAFLIAVIMAVVLCLARSEEKTNFWYAGFIFFMGLGLMAEFIDPKPSTVVALKIEFLTLIARFCSALSYRLGPYFFLLIGLSKIDIKQQQRKVLYSICSLPVIIGFVYDLVFWDQGFVRIYLDYSSSFWALSIWGITCGIITNVILFNSFFTEKNHKQRIHKLILFIITSPSLFLTYQAYINPLVVEGRHDFAYITGVFTSTLFLSTIIMAFKYGFLGIKLSIQRETRENSIKLITSGTMLIAHSLKNEIGKIHYAAETLYKVSTDTIHIEIADIIKNSTSYLQQIIERMRDQTQDIILMKEICIIGNIIDSVLDSMKNLLEERKIQVWKQFDFHSIIVCDKVHIHEVLQNILKNSIEALSKTGIGIININVGKHKRFVRIEVKDNGIGISKENLQHVFDPFFSTKRNESSFGLGLTYCLNVIRKHKGRLNINSKPGQGTSVLIDLPL